MVTNKIALGSAQFGLQYGIANKVGHVPIEHVSEILIKAREEGVDTIDTAIAYGNSENVLGLVGVEGFKVITKLPALPQSSVNIVKWVNSQVEQSLSRLKIEKLEGVLLHRADDITGSCAHQYQEALQLLKRDNLCVATGVSVYDSFDLERIWINSDMWIPDIIQAPLNIFDQRLIDSGWLSKLSQFGVRVHIRSTFLQGLLLMEPEARHSYFDPWKVNLEQWRLWCKSSGLGPLAAALNFVSSQPEVEKLVVGVDSVQQLREILSVEKLTGKNIWDSFKSQDVGLIDPRKWNLL